MARWPVWPVPGNLDIQPCDSADFAHYVVDCLDDGPRGVRPDFGGPQVGSVAEFAREYQAALGIHRRILPLHVPARLLRAAGRQVCRDGRRGTTTWAQWLVKRGS